MKKLFVLLFMVLAVWSYANVITMDYSVEMGWVPDASFGGYDTIDNYTLVQMKGYDHWNSFYTELATKLWFENVFYIGGGVTVQVHKTSDSISFDPDFTNYNFETGIKYGYVNLFFSHDCSHPQMTYTEYYRVTRLWGEGSINRFGIRVSNRK